MIGQENLIKQIQENFSKFPHFCIIAGQRGSGKKTLIHDIIYPLFEDEGYGRYVVEDIKIESIRDLIAQSYKSHNMLFVIPDADTMSIGAKNAMLKIVEECPNNNYFVMTLEDDNNTLATIRSRAITYHMDIYGKDELKAYMKQSKIKISDDYMTICETPGDINLLADMGPDEFYDYVDKVMTNIAIVSGSNSFKIAEKIAFKDDEEGKYDLRLFWKAFLKECQRIAVECLEQDERQLGVDYLIGARDTSRVLRRLSVKSINKQMLFDKWILDIREDWR